MPLSAKNSVVTPARAGTRIDFREPCVVERDGTEFPATAHNISQGGVCLDIQGMGSRSIDSNVKITFRNLPPVEAAVRWSYGSMFGLAFLEPIETRPDLVALFEELT